MKRVRSAPAAGLIAALAVVLASACSASSGSDESSTTTPATVAAGAATSLEAQYEAVIKQVLPSVVEISTDSGLGSGVIYDSSGNIVTNAHVVGSATTFDVQIASHAAAVKGTLVGAFPQGDLAVIKVSGQSGLHPAKFADSNQARLGQIVLAMGNPLGLSSSVTNGIISAVGRTLTEPQTADSPGATLPDSIQTSAAINPGNSGGALVNLQGQVVGIPTLAATDQQSGGAAPGIGFAIPSNTVKDIASQLVKDGKVTDTHRAALGVQVTTVTDPAGGTAGVGVVSVVSGGPAAKAGIQAGDIITKVHDTDVPNTQALSSVLANLDVGQTVSVTYSRGGESHTVKVTLGQLPG